MLSIADSSRLWARRTAFLIPSIEAIPFVSGPFRSRAVVHCQQQSKRKRLWLCIVEPKFQFCQPRLKRTLHLPRVGDIQRVLSWERATGPKGSRISRATVLSSVRSWSRNTADNWLFRLAASEWCCASPSTFRPNFFWPPFDPVRRLSSGFSASAGPVTSRSGASRSSSPAMPTNAKRA